MSPSCPACGSESSLESDSSSGSTVCTACGYILAENIIVSDISFQENASGTASVVGQFVPSSGPKALSSAGRGMPMGHSRASREITLQLAKRRIMGIASQVNVLSVVSESAINIYHLAAQANFTSGRRQNTVYAACLYVSCRRHKTSHMLVDFAQYMNASVFALGDAVLKLSQVLNMKLPIIDPSLYMHRFAAELELGNQNFPVANTALRLLAHMRRDWMHTGRRPSGICGACLLIAARMHNFSRSHKEVAQVVRIGENVLRQRLGEFSNTSSTNLTVADVEELDILDDPSQMEAAGDSLAPPSFQRLQIRNEKVRRFRQILSETPDLSKLLAPIDSSKESNINIDDHSDASIEEIIRQIDGAFRANPVLDEIYADLETASEQGDVALLESKDDEEGVDKKGKTVSGGDKDSVGLLKTVFGSSVSNEAITAIIEKQLTFKAPRFQLVALQKKKNNGEDGEVDSDDPDESVTTMTTISSSVTLCENDINIQKQLERKRAIEKAIAEMELYAAELDKETLSDVDDEECDHMILSPPEQERKERLWMHINEDFLKHQEEKRRIEAEQEKQGIAVRRRPANGNKKSLASVQEHAKKKLSDKLNYEALDSLRLMDPTFADALLHHSRETQTDEMSDQALAAADDVMHQLQMLKTEENTTKNIAAPVVTSRVKQLHPQESSQSSQAPKTNPRKPQPPKRLVDTMSSTQLNEIPDLSQLTQSTSQSTKRHKKN